MLSFFRENHYPGVTFSGSSEQQRFVTSMSLFFGDNDQNNYSFVSSCDEEGSALRYTAQKDGASVDLALTATGTQTNRFGKKYNYVGTTKFDQKKGECSINTSIRYLVHRN